MVPNEGFLRRLLPGEGLYCVAAPLQSGGFKHYFCQTIEEVQKNIAYLDLHNNAVYLAQASFKTDDNRKSSNALFLKNFFLDIDCGPDKDYPSQKEAVVALKDFLATTELPFPAIVSSGNGLYAHWIIDEMMPAESWKVFARMLKDLCVAAEFRVDPMRTADISSVLRPIGATHRKDPTNPKTVSLLKDTETLTLQEFVTAVKAAAKKVGVSTQPLNPPTTKGINDDFLEGLEGPPSSIAKIAGKCAQIGNFCTQKGNVSEPLWYAALGVMVFCADGDDYIQDWSSGHPDYSPQATSDKAQQYLDSGVGPSTCAQFGSINPAGCLGCPSKDKIKSPILLGRPEPVETKTEVLPTGEENTTPKGFRRAEDGLHVEQEGIWRRFYDQDLFVRQMAYDESLGYQVATVRHHLPHEGWLEFTFRSSLIHDSKALMTTFSDNHVHVLGASERKAMVAYVEGWLDQLKRRQRMAQLLNQMGWKLTNKGEHLFVLGNRLFHQDGTIEDANLARNVPTAAQGYKTMGDLNKWVEATEVLDRPGMEPLAFALLCGFAAPLMKFTGFDGAMISMVGSSGIGKTLLLRYIQSIYGSHSELMMLREDTKNALISRLGVYGNLPLTVDEVTNIDGQELSDLVYRVTQGRDKARLTKNSEERKVLNHWNTIAIVSTNASLIDKLSETKHDSTPELNRVFEYPVAAVPGFEGEVTSDLYWAITKNYGWAGERFINHLVQNVEAIGAGLAATQKKIDALTSIRGDERYWSAMAATAIYGGLVARKLGLIRFDVSKILNWACQQIIGMRKDKDDLAADAVSILGQFLDENVNNRLLVKGSGKIINVLASPRGPLVVRHEVDTDKLYFGRAIFKNWLSKRFGQYTAIKNELIACGALKNPNRQKALGAGTSFAGATQPCWELDMTNRKLGVVGLQVVQSAKELELRKEVEV